MTPKTPVAYQATDLARSHRQVIDAARSGRALIRDKDGMALLMIPAEDVERTAEVAELALDLVRAAQSLLGALRRLQRPRMATWDGSASYRWRPRLASSPR